MNFGVALEGGVKLIKYFSEKYYLDQDRVRVLISEFEAYMRKGSNIMTKQEEINMNLKKRGQRMMRWGVTDETLVAGLTIRFIDDD